MPLQAYTEKQADCWRPSSGILAEVSDISRIKISAATALGRAIQLENLLIKLAESRHAAYFYAGVLQIWKGRTGSAFLRDALQ